MKYVPFAIIQAAQHYDPEATGFVRRHFAGYIAYKALSPFLDEHGRLQMLPDDDLCYAAENALFAAMGGKRPVCRYGPVSFPRAPGGLLPLVFHSAEVHRPRRRTSAGWKRPAGAPHGHWVFCTASLPSAGR